MAFKRGTTIYEDPKPYIECATVGCLTSAQIGVKTKTGNANFCLNCYHTWIERERRERFEAADRPSAEESMRKIRAFAKMPKPTPREHWQRVLANPNAPKIAQDAATECLRRMGGLLEREPGQDDED